MKKPTMPTVVDDDEGTILVMKDGREIRGYAYSNSDERHLKMQRARDYVQGYVDATEKFISRIDNLMKRIKSGEDTR
jgi:hypothetical protein